MEINHLPVQHGGMAARVTLRDIADKCGCTIATVSRALRDRPEISPQRRAHIKKVAVELGYVPDPALAALVQHRQSLRSERYLAMIMPVEGSSLVDAGKSMPGLTDNFVGEAPDIGAYEFGGINWRPGYQPKEALFYRNNRAYDKLTD